jgi:hypothetical protein
MEGFTYIVSCSEEEKNNCFKDCKWGRFPIIPKQWENG